LPRPDYTALELPPPPEGRPYVILNMVMSADGKVVVEGTERGIGSKTDQELMRELRVNADVVLNGASTLRVSGTSSRLGDEALERIRVDRGKPPKPIAAIISRSGDLPLERIFFTARDFDAVVYLSSVVPEARQRDIEATGRPVVLLPAGDEMGAMLRHMRDELGAHVLLVEGGPTVNAQLWNGGLVDEYFLTLGPVIVGGKDTLTAVEGPHAFALSELPHLNLVSAVPNEETSEVYLRYRRRAS
jgi:riboflavin biosynthesis pyrimidine reductase